MNKEEIKEVEKLIGQYADIRIRFEEAKKKYPKYLSGNDNYIGIIGEYWAKKYLEKKYKNKEIINKSAEGNKSSKWVDFEVDGTFINVKTITNENEKRETGKIKFNDKPDGVCSVLVVKLDDFLKPEAILYLKDIDKILGIEGCLRKKLDERYIKEPNKKIYEWKENKEISFRYYKDGFDGIFENDCIKEKPFA